MPEQLRAKPSLLAPAGVAVALMLLWAIHDGGYDADTWYWGALLVLGLLTGVVALGAARPPGRSGRLALALLGAYVAWSFLSIGWAQAPGLALQGSDRALLYALLFALLLVLPWSAAGALLALSAYAIGVGVTAVVLLLRLASHDHIAGLFIDGRLTAPTGYFNSNAALFMSGALLATVLATRRELPGLVRGLLIGCACASLQLCVVGQSRGWLFTLPILVLAAVLVVRDRLRFAAAAALPAAATLIALHRLLAVFKGHAGAALDHAAMQAGRTALLLCAAMAVLATLIAWTETLRPARPLSQRTRRRAGAVVAALTVLAGSSGALAATGGHPLAFVKRQWHGFAHASPETATGSHFAAVGSGRYDFWRVALDATAAHPLGGLGQDNYAAYYVARRRTYEEPSWTHSLELRLLAHTGIVGALLFGLFLLVALAAAARTLRSPEPRAAALAAAGLLPLLVWLIHGSVDWFWEFPSLSGPALGFLAMAIALAPQAPRAAGRPRVGGPGTGGPPSSDPDPGSAGRGRLVAGPAVRLLGILALAAAVCALGFPYLSVREVSSASDKQVSDPVAALGELRTATDLNPLSAAPAELAGMIALRTGRYNEALERFKQAVGRDPGSWRSWLGAGLAATTLGDVAGAAADFARAHRIDPRGATVGAALDRVRTLHPLTPAQGLQMLENE